MHEGGVRRLLGELTPGHPLEELEKHVECVCVCVCVFDNAQGAGTAGGVLCEE